MRCCRRLAATALVLVAAAAWAQSGTDDAAAEGEGDDLDALFDAEMIEDESGNGAGDAAAADAGKRRPGRLVRLRGGGDRRHYQ